MTLRTTFSSSFRQPFQLSCVEHIFLHAEIVHVSEIGLAVGIRHSHVEQALAGLLQARRAGIVLDAVVLQVIQPFL